MTNLRKSQANLRVSQPHSPTLTLPPRDVDQKEQEARSSSISSDFLAGPTIDDSYLNTPMVNRDGEESFEGDDNEKDLESGRKKGKVLSERRKKVIAELTEEEKKFKGPPFVGHVVKTAQDPLAQQKKLELNDPNVVKWDGPNDPMNPQNFPTWRKWLIVILISTGQACVYCASSIISTAFPGIEKEFEVSPLIATLGISFFMTGLGLGPMLMSPFSEFLGRNIIYRTSLLFFVGWMVGAALVPNLPVYYVIQFVSGFSGSAFLSVGGGSVSDLFARHRVGFPMLIYTLSPFIGPVMGPIIGGFVNQDVNWRWTWCVMAVWAFVQWVLIFIFVPETYAPILLKRKAIAMRKETGNMNLLAPIERHKKSLPKTLLRSCKRPFELLFFEPMILLLCIWTAILRGILYLFFTSFEIVFSHHGFTHSQVGLSFFGIAIGLVLATFSYPLWSRIYKWLIVRNAGYAPPEFRLPPSMAGAFLCPIGLFWFAFCSFDGISWVPLVLAGIPFGAGILLVYTGVFTFLVDAYQIYAASALAANAFLRCGFAAVFPLFGRFMYARLGDVGAGALIAGLTTLMLPLPFIFFVFGHRIRAKSKFAAG